jgi:hypothetical protein
MEDFPRVKAVNPSDFWKFVKNALPPNKPMVARADKGGPEWMVKMIDGDNQHLLCIHLKSGEENYSMEEVIDELAKGPEAEITGKDCTYSQIAYKEARTHGIKLTFVFGAISHANVKNFLGCNNANLAPGSNSRLGALRMTHESYKKLPENVEVIILLEAGLINLLGLENYLLVKKYNENTVLENRVLKAGFSNEENQLANTPEDVKVLESFLERKASAYKDRFNIELSVTVTPKNSARPDFLLNDETLSIPECDADAPLLSVAGDQALLILVSSEQQVHGVKRAHEESDDVSEESARKKQRNSLPGNAPTIPQAKEERMKDAKDV